MKNKILTLAATCVLAAVGAVAALPTFRTFSAGGNTSYGATVLMPADANSQIRVVSINYSSDTVGAALAFSSGVGAYYLAATNAATSTVTNQINSTNGLSIGSILVLQHGGVLYTNQVVTWNSSTNLLTGNGTNVVLATGGWGVLPTLFDDIYQMSAPVTLIVGSGTNAINGDAVFVGNYGRPVIIAFPVATATNRLSLVSVHYDSASQN